MRFKGHSAPSVTGVTPDPSSSRMSFHSPSPIHTQPILQNCVTALSISLIDLSSFNPFCASTAGPYYHTTP